MKNTQPAEHRDFCGDPTHLGNGIESCATVTVDVDGSFAYVTEDDAGRLRLAVFVQDNLGDLDPVEALTILEDLHLAAGRLLHGVYETARR